MNECRIHIHVRDAGLQFCQREIINILFIAGNEPPAVVVDTEAVCEFS